MREKYELLMEQIDEGKYTGREILLTGAVLYHSDWAFLGRIYVG